MKNLKTKTEMIKCTFNNAVHKLLNPNPVKNSESWKVPKVELTDKQKIELFDKIVELDKLTSNELSWYWFKRRSKKRIEKARIERGVKPKNKTTKGEWVVMKNELEKV